MGNCIVTEEQIQQQEIENEYKVVAQVQQLPEEIKKLIAISHRKIFIKQRNQDIEKYNKRINSEPFIFDRYIESTLLIRDEYPGPTSHLEYEIRVCRIITNYSTIFLTFRLSNDIRSIDSKIVNREFFAFNPFDMSVSKDGDIIITRENDDYVIPKNIVKNLCYVDGGYYRKPYYKFIYQSGEEWLNYIITKLAKFNHQIMNEVKSRR
jgi:hypothetical protein